MIRFALSDSDWQTCKGYWGDLRTLFAKPDDAKKAQFMDRVLFESSSLNDSSSKPSIPSIDSMAEIMNQIDEELKNDQDNQTDIKTNQLQTTTERKYNYTKELKRFIHEPVKSLPLFI